MPSRPPLRLFWWNKTANFGDGISPLVVAYASGRDVVWSAPEEAEIFAIGSIMRVVARNYRSGRDHRPVVWGSGCMKPVGRGFTTHVEFAALRGPRSAEVLQVSPETYGDPGLLIRDAMGADIQRTDEVAVVPHHAQRSDPVFSETLSAVDGIRLVDVTDEATEVVARIASCRHVISSSLHGLVVADAFGIPSTWMDPVGIHAEARFKFEDYALSIDRKLEEPIKPTAIPALLASLADETPEYCKRASLVAQDLKSNFPQSLAA